MISDAAILARFKGKSFLTINDKTAP